MKLKVEHIIILILVGYILFLQQCTEPKKIFLKDSQLNIKDSVVVSHVIDTIPFKYPVPVLVDIPITPPTSTEIDTLDGSVINNYTLSVEDSLIKGTLFSKIDGTLIDQNFEYVPKFPKFIKETVTKEIYPPKRNLLFVTGTLEGNETFFSPKLGLSLYQKKGYLYSATYDPINKLIGVGIGVQLNNRK